MSSILDALRKIEREEEGPPKATLRLGTEGRRGGSRWSRPGIGTAVAVALMGAVTATLWLSGKGEFFKGRRAEWPAPSGNAEPSSRTEEAAKRELAHAVGPPTENDATGPTGATITVPEAPTTAHDSSSAGKEPPATSPPPAVARQAAGTDDLPPAPHERTPLEPHDESGPERPRGTVASEAPEFEGPAMVSSRESNGRVWNRPFTSPARTEPDAEVAQGGTQSDSTATAPVATAIPPTSAPVSSGDRGALATKQAERIEAPVPVLPGPAATNAELAKGTAGLLSPTRVEEGQALPDLAGALKGQQEEPSGLFQGQPQPAPANSALHIPDSGGPEARPGNVPRTTQIIDEAKLRLEESSAPPPQGAASPSPGAEESKATRGAEGEEVLRRRPHGAPYVRVSFLFYSHEPARRRVMVTVNDGGLVTLFEGQSVEDLGVERILQDEVHFRYQGKLFAVRPRN